MVPLNRGISTFIRASASASARLLLVVVVMRNTTELGAKTLFATDRQLFRIINYRLLIESILFDL